MVAWDVLVPRVARAEQGTLLVAAAMFAAAMALIAGPVVPGGPGLPRIPDVPGVRGPGVPGGPAAGLWTAARTPHPGGLPSRKGPHYQGVGLPHAQ
jgi:hypothetical protein